MNKIELKEFQEKAIDFISSKLKTKEIVKLQSPTGSGKTLMTAKIVENFLKSYSKDFFKKITIIYISLSSGGLDHQSYTKINKLLNDGFVSGFETKYIGIRSKFKSSDLKINNYIQGINEFKRNTIYFLGWGILTANSKAFKEGEEDNIFNIIRRTKFSKTKILLVIDEAHRDNPFIEHTKSVAKERIDFLNELAPDRQFWMSATFLSLKKPIVPDYVVSAEEVKAEGVIKQDIIINEEVDSEWNNDFVNRKLIKNALLKKKEIEDSIAKASQKFNPLILIQIPDGNPRFNNISVNNYYLKMIDDLLQKEGLAKGMDYGVYLSEIKTNVKKEIESNNSPLQIIIFKQAIATGWDIPRANILVKLRKPSTRTDSFELQTLGRILRNPYLKVYKRGGHLTNEDVSNLNNAFVFTNDKDYSSFIRNEYEYEFIDKNTTLEKEIFHISKKASKIKLKLNNLIINDIKHEIWNEIQDNLFENKIFIKNLISNVNNFYKDEKGYGVIAKAKSFDAALASEGTLKVNPESQLSFDIVNDKKNREDLYFIYIEFLQATNGFKIIEKIVRSLAYHQECKYTIKELFVYFTNKYNDIFENELTLKQKINDILYELIKPHIKYNVNGNFNLSKKIFFYKKMVSKIPKQFEQDTLINSYLMDIKTTTAEYKPAFDSLQEHIFYQWFKAWKWLDKDKKKIHLFRNGINPINSYFIEYIDVQSMKKRKFFPDFIVTTKNKIIILEVKGIGKNNIDFQAESKLKSISQDLEKMKKEKEVLVFKVGSLSAIRNDDDFICYQYINGKRMDTYKLNDLKKSILQT